MEWQTFMPNAFFAPKQQLLLLLWGFLLSTNSNRTLASIEFDKIRGSQIFTGQQFPSSPNYTRPHQNQLDLYAIILKSF
jgi:hypothetical protein